MGIGKVVHPHGGVGIDSHDIGVQKVVGGGEGAVDGFAHHTAIVVHIGGVFRNHHLLFGIYAHIGVEHTFFGIEAVLAQCRLFVVEDFVAEEHLALIEHFRAVNVGGVEAVDGALLILVGFAPREGFVPVEMRLHRIAIAVGFNLVGFIAPEGRVGQALAEDTVAHPFHKLPIHRVGHFGLVHPKAIDRNLTIGHNGAPKRVLLAKTHFQKTAFHFDHTIRRRFHGRSRATSHHLTSIAHGSPASAKAGNERCGGKQTDDEKKKLLHIVIE